MSRETSGQKYSSETVIGACLGGAGFTALGVGLEGVMASAGMTSASDPLGWGVLGVVLLCATLLYGRSYSWLPGVGAE